MENDLTVVLTLRGRHLYTLRWLWYANKIKFPYHIIIADGEVNPTIERLLSDSSTFSNLSYEYCRYIDITFSDFYKKCTDVVRKVKTKYVVLSDNDDFPIITGLKKCISQLNNKSEYVCAGGEIPSFSITNKNILDGQIIGSDIDTEFGYLYQKEDNIDLPIFEQIINQIKNHKVHYYNVYRTEKLEIIFSDIEKLDFSDLVVHEVFAALRAISLGKVLTDHSIINYYRQRGTSSGFSYKDLKWLHAFLRGKISRDVNFMADKLAYEISKNHDVNYSFVKEGILNEYGELLQQKLSSITLQQRFKKVYLLLTKIRHIKSLLISWKPSFTNNQDRLLKILAKNTGENTLLFDEYKDEFSNIHDALKGTDFLQFVKNNADDLT